MEEKTANGFKVLYIDYGNRSTVTLDQLRSLDTSYTGMAPQVSHTTLPGLGKHDCIIVKRVSPQVLRVYEISRM